ncbi:PIN domain-containing protein [Candidatus Bathyarchaeota archaeon]|nr:PIN domain-containing protein [Candidatus Bathyarchaeota archaeon]
MRGRGKTRGFSTIYSYRNNYSIVYVNIELGELAGKIRASTGLRLPDAIIVATGIITEADWVITEDTHLSKPHLTYLQSYLTNIHLPVLLNPNIYKKLNMLLVQI